MDQHIAFGRIDIDIQHIADLGPHGGDVRIAEHAGHDQVQFDHAAVEGAPEQARGRVVEQFAVTPFRLFDRALTLAFDGDVAQGAGRGDIVLEVDRVGADFAEDARAVLAHHAHLEPLQVARTFFARVASFLLRGAIGRIDQAQVVHAAEFVAIVTEHFGQGAIGETHFPRCTRKTPSRLLLSRVR